LIDDSKSLLDREVTYHPPLLRGNRVDDLNYVLIDQSSSFKGSDLFQPLLNEKGVVEILNRALRQDREE
jgi:hypothetical protein